MCVMPRPPVAVPVDAELLLHFYRQTQISYVTIITHLRHSEFYGLQPEVYKMDDDFRGQRIGYTLSNKSIFADRLTGLCLNP